MEKRASDLAELSVCDSGLAELSVCGQCACDLAEIPVPVPVIWQNCLCLYVEEHHTSSEPAEIPVCGEGACQ